MKEPRKPSEVLLAARRADSATKRAKVTATVEKMIADGIPVTFAAVARAAQVSNWLVYAPGVREHIEAARRRTPPTQPAAGRPADHASIRSLRTDLQHARQEIRSLRAERDQLKEAIRRNLGRQIEAANNGELVTRIHTLDTQVQALTAERDQAVSDAATLIQELDTTRDDLAACRSNLRRMIRASTPSPNSTT